MKFFSESTHLSFILEESKKSPIIIFKYSNSCNSSQILRKKLETLVERKIIKHQIFLVTVQTMPILSSNISTWFKIKHESPQVFLISNGNILYTAHHEDIDTEKLM